MGTTQRPVGDGVRLHSWHWVEPDVGFAKAAAVLDDHGVFAVLSTPVVVPQGADRFWWDVQDDWEAVSSGRLDPATKHPDMIGDQAAAIQASGWFDHPTTRRYRFDVVMNASEYVANLSTQSGVRQLPASAQVSLLERVRQRVEAHGGILTVHHLAVLTVARRRSSPSPPRT